MSSSIPPAQRVAWGFILGAASAAGGAAVALFGTWWAGVASQGDVGKARDEAVRSCHEALVERLGTDPRKEQPGTVYGRLDSLEQGRSDLSSRDALQTRELVGLRVALHIGTDPRRREAASSAARSARGRFDDLMLNGRNPHGEYLTPREAAERALEEAGVPR